MSGKINNRDVFVIPVNQNYLVYAPSAGITSLVNRAGALELQKQLRLIEKNQTNEHSKLFELARDILQSPLLSPSKKTGALNPEFLGIIPTRRCNGACNYCDFGASEAPAEKMSYKLAAEIVDWYAALLISRKRNVLEVHFFGGEPMMAQDVIEVVVHRARLVSREHDLFPFFEISTNGQYSVRNATFLGQYFNKVVLSLDGPKEIQNKHRPLKGNNSSFENALETAIIISNSNAELCIRCCISHLNVFQMEEIAEWFCQNFRLSAINFEILCANPLTESKGLYPPDPVDFAIQFQKARKLAHQYGVEVVYASDISERPLVSSCPVGKDTVIISPDDRISNCYLMPENWQKVNLDLDFGFLYSKDKANIDLEKLNEIRRMVEDKPRCNTCFCQWSCAGGCHVGNTFPGCSLEYDDFCKQTRLISAFSLLLNLGMAETIEALINATDGLNNIIYQESDKMEDYG